ncbi:helix-turn-helix domain-containing protein [Micromonospora chersina]
MVTLRLTATDLSRTVLRSAPSALLELGAAGQRVLRSGPPAHLAAWRARTRAAVTAPMRPYLDLCRRPDWFPDFLTPPGLGSDLAGALAEVGRTPTEVLAAELRPRIEAGDLLARVAPLAAGDPEARRLLREAMVAFHAVAVGPYWRTVVAAVHADRAVRGRALVDAEIDRVLRDLSPHLRFTPTGRSYELSYECAFGAGVVLTPDGRGVTLVPSYFVPQPVVLDDPTGPMVLAYPIPADPARADHRHAAGGPAGADPGRGADGGGRHAHHLATGPGGRRVGRLGQPARGDPASGRPGHQPPDRPGSAARAHSVGRAAATGRNHGGGQSPVTPSMRSRIRSAWPLCRAYSSIMWT